MRTALKRKKREVHRHQGNTGAMLFTLLLAILCGLAVYILSDISFMRPSREISLLISESAKKEEISPALLEAVILTESKFDKKAVSHVGAIGMMQLMPGTARMLGVDDPFDPVQNLEGGIKYLSQLSDKYQGDLVKTLAAYNAGPGRVDSYGGVPPFAETQKYVKNVLSMYRKNSGSDD